MGFRYMVSGSQLAAGAYGRSRRSGSAVRAKAKTAARSRIHRKAWLLLAANAITYTVVGLFLADKNRPGLAEMLTFRSSVVSGIIVRENDRAAVVYGQVVYEGQTVNQCKVLEIHPDRVVLEKDGKRFARWLYR